MIEKEMAEAILEAIELKLSPIREKIEKIENLERVSHADLENLQESLKADLQAASCTDLKAFIDDTGKKFHVTAKIIGPLMRVLRKQLSANVCDKDIKGLIDRSSLCECPQLLFWIVRRHDSSFERVPKPVFNGFLQSRGKQISH